MSNASPILQAFTPFFTTNCFHYMYFREAEEPLFHWQKTNIKVSSLQRDRYGYSLFPSVEYLQSSLLLISAPLLHPCLLTPISISKACRKDNCGRLPATPVTRWTEMIMTQLGFKARKHILDFGQYHHSDFARPAAAEAVQEGALSCTLTHLFSRENAS